MFLLDESRIVTLYKRSECESVVVVVPACVVACPASVVKTAEHVALSRALRLLSLVSFSSVVSSARRALSRILLFANFSPLEDCIEESRKNVRWRK